MLSWLLCLLVFVIGTTVSQLEVPVHMFSLCGVSQSGHFVSVPRRVRCIPPQPEHITETPVAVYVPCSMPGQIPTFKSSFRKRTICMRTGILGPSGSQGIVSDQVSFSSVSPEVCQATVATKQIFIGGRFVRLVEKSPGLWTSNGSLEIAYKYCCYDYCSAVEIFILEEGVLTSMDGSFLSSNLGDVSGCHAKLGHCSNLDYVVVWDPANLTNLCPFEEKGTYRASVGDRHVLIEKLQVAFSYVKPPLAHACLPKGIAMMDQGIGLLFP